MEACDLITTKLLNENTTFIVVMQSFSNIYGGRLHGWICAIMCSFAAISNVVNIVVLTRPKMQNPVNVVLTGMAASDFGTMTSYVIFVSIFYLSHSDPYSFGHMLFIEVHMFVTVVLHSNSIWLNVFVAFLRYMILRNSHSYQRSWMQLSYIGILVVTIAAVITMLSIPMLLAYQIDHIHDDIYNVDITTWATQNNCLLLRTFLWTQGILFKVLPCVLLTVLILCLVVVVRSAQRRSARLLARTNNNKARKTDRTTTLLICVTSFALITEIPQGIVAILFGIYPHDVITHLYPVVGDLMDLMGLANSSINFFLYYGMSTQYRVTFWKLFLPQKVYIEIYGNQSSHMANGRRQSAYVTTYGGITTTQGGLSNTTQGGNGGNTDVTLWQASQEDLTVNGYIRRTLVAAFSSTSGYIATKLKTTPTSDRRGLNNMFRRRSSNRTMGELSCSVESV